MNTVLAIDDDKTTLNLITAQLGAMGYRVFTESSGRQGVEIAKSFNPDIILLDLHMPGMDGMQVLSALRRDRATKDIPVMMLTAEKGKDSVIEAMRNGVVDYIVKPYIPEVLRKKITSVIGLRLGVNPDNFDDLIDVSRKGDLALVTMRGGISTEAFEAELKTVFNPFFMKQLQGKKCIFDIRAVNDLLDPEIRTLMKYVESFKNTELHIVAGKHYGVLVSGSDIEEVAGLYLSFSDLELALNIEA